MLGVEIFCGDNQIIIDYLVSEKVNNLAFDLLACNNGRFSFDSILLTLEKFEKSSKQNLAALLRFQLVYITGG